MKLNLNHILLGMLIALGLYILVSPSSLNTPAVTATLATLMSGGLLWLLYQKVKVDPEAFSKVKMSQSLTTVLILALILCTLVSLAVMLLK